MFRARMGFWFALFLTIICVPMLPTFEVWAQQNANQTFPITALANVTTQIIPTGGAFPNTPFGITTLVIGTTGATASSQWSLYAGSVNNDTPPCATGRTVLTGALPIGYSGLAGTQVVFTNQYNAMTTVTGNPAIAAPGGAAICLAYTGGAGAALTGWATINR